MTWSDCLQVGVVQHSQAAMLATWDKAAQMPISLIKLMLSSERWPIDTSQPALIKVLAEATMILSLVQAGVVSIQKMALCLRANGEAGCCRAICLICLKIRARKVVMETRRISVLQRGSVRVSSCIYSGMNAEIQS